MAHSFADFCRLRFKQVCVEECTAGEAELQALNRSTVRHTAQL
jgi:hypothetical protein